jgi:Asp-tRNA(Asn)/Glu-tRNA(Gln) amidotransferase A subunit family amidase
MTAGERVDEAARRAAAAAHLNAMAVDRFTAARREAAALHRAGAAGPLAGMPVTVKESLWVRGTPAGAGIPRLAAARSRADGAVAAALRVAGALIVGKGNVAQALWYAESDNPVYGRTANPWAADRTPGGSSGGDAALVAAGVVPAAVGSDIGGSVRLPAAWCGIFGLKPTPGRWSTRGSRDDALFRGAPIANAPGLLARDVEMLRRLAAALDAGAPGTTPAGPPARVPTRLRVGVITSNGVLEPVAAVRRAVLEAAARLEATGHEAVPFDVPDARRALELFDAAFVLDGGRRLGRLVAGGPLHPHLRRALDAAAAARAAPRALAAELAAYRAAFARALDRAGVDALVGPVHAVPAVPHGMSAAVVAGQSYASLYNLVGLPAGVVPVTRVRAREADAGRTGGRQAAAVRRVTAGSEGLPVAVQIAARPGRDDLVLSLLERISGH